MVAHGIREDLENEGEPVPEFYELVQTAQDRMANSGFVWNIGCFPIILFFVLLFEAAPVAELEAAAMTSRMKQLATLFEVAVSFTDNILKNS